jgi:hypothetical protein
MLSVDHFFPFPIFQGKSKLASMWQADRTSKELHLRVLGISMHGLERGSGCVVAVSASTEKDVCM